ncbi:hypothetical protein ACFX16_028137 [Malus domestica]
MYSILILVFPTCAFSHGFIFFTRRAYPIGTGARGLGPSISSNRSFKKHNNNAQGGAKASAAIVNTKDSSIASAQHDSVQNGARVHPQLHGGSDTPVASTLPGQLKLQPLREAPELFQRLRLLSQRSSRTFPKAPTSQRSSRTVPKVPRALTSQEHPLR